MERFFEKITRALVENGNIREEEEEVYQYALKSMLILGGNILLSLMIGVCMGMPGYCVLFLCMLVPLRSDAGGYHAPNLFICYLLSFASLILTMFWAKETSVFQLAIVSALALGSLLLIFLFAPLDSKNRPLEGQERKCIRKRARIVVCLEWITGGLLLLVSPPAAYTVWSAIVWSGVGYIAWYLERKIEAREDYHKRLLAKEILDGNFGEIAGNVFRSMSSKEQEILLGGWLNSFRTGSVLPVFLDMVHGLVADSIVYHNNAYPDEILIYTGWKRERNLEQRIRFLIDTFLDIRYRVEIFYEYHFGIIGVEETMRIGEIAIC